MPSLLPPGACLPFLSLIGFSIFSLLSSLSELFVGRVRWGQEVFQVSRVLSRGIQPSRVGLGHPDPTRPVRTDPTRPVRTDPTRPVGTDPTRPVGTDPTRPVGTDPTQPVRTDPTRPVRIRPILEKPSFFSCSSIFMEFYVAQVSGLFLSWEAPSVETC